MRPLQIDTSKPYNVKSKIKNYYVIIPRWSLDLESTPCQISKRLKILKKSDEERRSHYVKILLILH